MNKKQQSYIKVGGIDVVWTLCWHFLAKFHSVFVDWKLKKINDD